MQYIKLIILGAGTVLIIWFSWFLSLRYRRYHGISRFFAFESVFILLLLNYSNWFKSPFTPIHIISWLCLIISAYTVVAGYLLLRNRGNPTINFEDTSVLVKSGIYGYIRHPLYLSVFLLGTGILLKDPGTLQIILGVINLVAVWLTALIEEREMIARFGDPYRIYMKETRMFIPCLL
ncbi:MAG TPA: isoprenylcysteine carboxylmethyltransferase family protein [Bacteroidales bacterium]|nr:isoprenylcysteine carboxylmethyltransferase family protein [Bacteroidales bacterium]